MNDQACTAAIDLNSQRVNENSGHEAGERLIAAAVQALRIAALEAYDVSSDEFYAHADNDAELRAGLERACAALTEPTIIENRITCTGPSASALGTTIAQSEYGTQW